MKNDRNLIGHSSAQLTCKRYYTRVHCRFGGFFNLMKLLRFTAASIEAINLAEDQSIAIMI
jgi:hypothetical protein